MKSATAKTAEGPHLRLAELLASLSLACDLANAFPMEKGLRNGLLAWQVASAMGLKGSDLSDAYYVGLLRAIGCTSFAHEEAALAGDDISFRNTFAGVDFTHPPDVLGTMVNRLGKGTGPVRRAKTVASVVKNMKTFGPSMATATCEAGARLAERLGMNRGVVDGVNQIYERWDGKGIPQGLAGDDVSLNALLANFAHVVTIRHTPGDVEGTREMVRRRSGGEFAPDIVDAFLKNSGEFLSAIEVDSAWDVTLGVEPRPHLQLPHTRLPEIATAFAHFADLKSPFTLTHSSGVAGLAKGAAKAAGMTDHEVETITVGALVHDLGRVSVSNLIWDKAGPLTPPDWERVRLHAYYSERILSHAALLPYARLAGMHHERLDESGYHRGLPAALIPKDARILAAADAYHAMTEDRPHRPGLSADAAAKALMGEAEAGKLDREAVAAVLDVSGHPTSTSRRPAASPAGLTDREIEVLRLVARGHHNREIASNLFISEHTVRHHVIHIYQKIGFSTRAGAALFAMENNLLGS